MTQPSLEGSINTTSIQMQKPATFHQVVGFYYDFVKPLYSTIQVNNALPQEILFEINAAFDHLTRHWRMGEPEEAVVAKSYSHLKRSCLDVFKLSVKLATDQYAELRSIDTSVIDNGDFDRGLVEVFTRIRLGAKNAKVNEGDYRASDSQADHAFTLWLPVYEDCVLLDKKFYQHVRLDWARKKERRGIWKERLISFALGVIASILASVIYDHVHKSSAAPVASPPSVTQIASPNASSVSARTSPPEKKVPLTPPPSKHDVTTSQSVH